MRYERFCWLIKADGTVKVLSTLLPASGVIYWPLQNLAMASYANEKQRARGMLGGDPFKAPRSPPPVSSTGPRDESGFTAEDDENTGSDC